jgi:putative membrane protein
MTGTVRRPAVFSADDPRLVAVEADEAQRHAAQIEADAVDAADQLPAVQAAPKRRVPWASMFWSALSGLVVLGLGLAVSKLIEDLFARAPWLGAIGLALAVIAGLALLVLILREVIGLARLATVEALRRRATEIVISDDRNDGRALVADMLSLTKRMPVLARARARLAEHRSDIIDGRDLIRLAERELMTPLDAEARRLVVAASKRVSVVTAISPRAAVDMIFVLVNGLRLVRQIAVLYGARPGTLGVLKLLRQVISHLAVTGGIGLSDSLLQQVIGHGLATRLSARLGEGMVNGLLTARLGLLTIDQVRPLPLQELPRPALGDLAGTLMRSTSGRGDSAGAPGKNAAP